MIERILTADSLHPFPDAGACYRLGPAIILLLLNDRTGLVLNLQGDFFALSDTATALLVEMIQTDADTAVQRLARRYQISPSQISHDLETCARSYLRMGVICPAGTAPQDMAALPGVLMTGLGGIHRQGLQNLERQAWWFLVLAYLGVRRWGWPMILRGCQHFLACPHRPEDIDAIPPGQVERIEAAVTAVVARHPLPLACKERALLAWWLLRRHQLPARLVLGVELFPLGTHVWCQVADRVIADLPERCARLTPVMHYD